MSMVLKYKDAEGALEIFDLAEKAITLGRSTEADILIEDEKVSRMHCGIRYEDGEYSVRDLKSRNGTYVNGELVDWMRLSPGDKIRLGSTLVTFDEKGRSGPNTALREVQERMDEGKGYGTILREIVSTTDEPAHPPLNPPRRRR